MIEFFTLLFFSGSLLLTPKPIDIGKEWVNLIPNKPIEAVNGGASLELEVTKAVGNADDVAKLDKMLPAGTIEAELIPEKGLPFILRNSSAYVFSDNKVSVKMMANSAVPTKIKFNRVRVRSSVSIKSVSVTWINSSL